MPDMEHSIWAWVAFNAVVLILLALDLGVFHRESHAISTKEAALWSVFWVALSLAFNLGIYFVLGKEPALEFLAGYLVEKSLSVDNVFVFIMIFTYFGVRPEWQHRVLFWGIFGALVMRAAMIFAGATLIERFHWILYIFGAFLIYTGYKMITHKSEDGDPERNPVLRYAKKVLPLTTEYHGEKFRVRQGGKWVFTPLFLVLIMIETSDVAFALDSIPAIFAVTRDPFIVYTSNVAAILGLRSLYFLLAGIMGHFHYLHYGLGAVLSFVGIKMLIEPWWQIPTSTSLLTIGAILCLAIGASLAFPKKEEGAANNNDS